jgi:hypothetical protein
MRTGIRRGLRTTLAGTLLIGGLATVSLAAASALTAGTASAVGPVFSSITPGTYTVIVPTGVTYVTITAVGGSGGSDVGDDIAGGEGGIVTQNVSVTPGESLTVTVGANGQCAPDSAGCNGLGGSGYGSGGNSVSEGGGGGGSAVVDNGTVIVVAGGGGGAGGGSNDPQGGNADQSGAGSGGGPGTLSGPGGGACVTIPDYFCAQPGYGMKGGNGASGGAGGGGFFGGGAGTSGGLTNGGGGGGGGASYPAPATRWDTTATPSVTINPDPTTAVLIPSNGTSLSGTAATLDASASNATSVEFLLFGGIYGYAAPVICTSTLTYYGWVCSWNTTTVPDGFYALVSEASGPGGSAYSSGVSITIDNPPPTTAVLIPSNGTSLSGTAATLDASASNATSVEFRLFGGSYGFNAPVLCTATPTYYGWLCSWNTTTVPNGTYALLSEAFGAGGSTFSSGVSITIDN